MFWLLSLEPGTPDARVAAIARDATRASGLSVIPAAELARATVSEFVWTSGAGTVLLSTSGLALVVAAMVVSQVMRAAVLAAVREYAALGAFGIGSRRLVRLVLLQGCLVAVVSLAVTAVFTIALLEVLGRASIPHALPLWLAVLAMGALCAVLAASTVLATRHLRHADPASLFR
jgi:ABC-type antimicrobial peptide transport system permease subunit